MSFVFGDVTNPPPLVPPLFQVRGPSTLPLTPLTLPLGPFLRFLAQTRRRLPVLFYFEVFIPPSSPLFSSCFPLQRIEAPSLTRSTHVTSAASSGQRLPFPDPLLQGFPPRSFDSCPFAVPNFLVQGLRHTLFSRFATFFVGVSQSFLFFDSSIPLSPLARPSRTFAVPCRCSPISSLQLFARPSRTFSIFLFPPKWSGFCFCPFHLPIL